MQILVIDDEEEILDVLQDILESDGHEVSIARDVAEGLDILNDRHYGLIITDLCMPRINGKYIIELIRLRFPDLPIMVLSAYVESEEELYELGATKILGKPVSVSVLLELLKEITV